jgi:hypothetical protein
MRRSLFHSIVCLPVLVSALLIGYEALFFGDRAKTFLDGPDKDYTLPAASVFLAVQIAVMGVFLLCCTLLPPLFHLSRTLGACEERIRRLEEELDRRRGGEGGAAET